MIIDVQKTAKLSKLTIPQDKADYFENSMQDIAQMLQVLSEVGECPCDGDSRRAELREDEVCPCDISREEIMRSAPSSFNGTFCVPKTVE